MKIVIPGGSGQVGNLLARSLHANGDDVVVLSRKPFDAPWRVAAWDGASQGDWGQEIDGSDGVINLAGRSVNCRYDAANRKEIMDSRVISVRAVGEAIANSHSPPPVWLQASTATIYAHTLGPPNDEATGMLGGSEPNAPDTWRFSIDVAKSWEAELDMARTPNTRKIAMRSAMTMTPDKGGVFDTLLSLARKGLGGSIAGGSQFVSWVHGDDFVRAVEFLIRNEGLIGPVNIASPNPIPQRDFMRVIRKAWGIPIGLPATKWMLEIGTWLMGSESELILKSRRVVPKRLTDAGFEFRFAIWSDAANELVASMKGN